jgi:hypothetical protein
MSRLAAEEASDGTIGLTQPVANDGVGSYRGPYPPSTMKRHFGSKSEVEVRVIGLMATLT